MYEINTDFKRPETEWVARAQHLYFCIVGCRVGPRYIMDPGIKPLDRDWRICGPAFTVRPEYTTDVLMGQIAGKYVQPGDVVVVDAGGERRAAAWGATMAHAIKAPGGAGIVVDGYVLTAEVLRKREGIPVFARGTVSRSDTAERPGWLNVPVICGGVIVNPGDLILGDEDGVVVVPRARVPEIIGLVEGRGNEREGARRPLDGNIPPREPRDIPYYQSSGAETKLKARTDVVIR